MAYIPQTWANLDPTTPVSADRLNHIESGIAAADTAATAAAAAAASEAAARSSAITAEAAARNSAITTAINNLLNGAPGALDTLKELADAINDDGSFAATVTTALAGKAPITTTTIDLVDRTNNTTETVPAGTTTNCSTAGVTKTAPALDNPVATPPKRFAIKNLSTGSITVAYPDQAGSAQSLTMLTGETRTFRQKSTSGWGVESGAVAVSTYDARYQQVVVHGSTAGTARPTGAIAVLWVGTATPANAVTDDEWLDKSGTLAVLRRYNGTSFDPLGITTGTAPTDGQILRYSTSTGLWTPANPTGNSEIAYGELNSGAATTGVTNAAVDIPGCSIVVPASARPVYLNAALTVSPTSGAGTAGAFASLSITEVTNGVDAPITWVASVMLPTTGWQTIILPSRRLAASTARTRTFKLQAQTSTSSLVVNVFNGFGNEASWISAEAR